MTDTPQLLPIEIKNRWDGRVLYRTTTAKTLAAALVEAVAAKADLTAADLYQVSLPYGARLDGARLDGARLVGARLVGARLDGGVKVARGSRAAYAGPVGDSSRTVYGFIAQPDDQRQKTWLVLVCGCFTGDEKAYRERITKYKKGSAEHAQCLAALIHCKAISKTWKIEAEPKVKAAKATA